MPYPLCQHHIARIAMRGQESGRKTPGEAHHFDHANPREPDPSFRPHVGFPRFVQIHKNLDKIAADKIWSFFPYIFRGFFSKIVVKFCRFFWGVHNSSASDSSGKCLPGRNLPTPGPDPHHLTVGAGWTIPHGLSARNAEHFCQSFAQKIGRPELKKCFLCPVECRRHKVGVVGMSLVGLVVRGGGVQTLHHRLAFHQTLHVVGGSIGGVDGGSASCGRGNRCRPGCF